MLEKNPEKRITAEEALNHFFFKTDINFDASEFINDIDEINSTNASVSQNIAAFNE